MSEDVRVRVRDSLSRRCSPLDLLSIANTAASIIINVTSQAVVINVNSRIMFSDELSPPQPI